MGDRSAIEWTDATWNPIVGCSIVSPGCKNCYAMKVAARLQKINRTGGSGTSYVNHYDGTTREVNGHQVWTGKLARAPKAVLYKPLGWTRPRDVFVNSMGDLFHDDIPDEWIMDILTVIAIADRHRFQVLTKRSRRMREFMSRKWLLDDIYANWSAFSGGPREVYSWPLHNLWLGVSAEDAITGAPRIADLRETLAAVRFVSYEPALGPPPDIVGMDWVIAGGESGPGARPMRADWARLAREQCWYYSIPFFFKQWGEWIDADHWLAWWRAQGYEFKRLGNSATPVTPLNFEDAAELAKVKGVRYEHQSDGSTMLRVGKKAAGRLLDGVEHNAMPERSR